jgi:DNA-binding transcriptional regulator YdaS (Cro superfamily)
VLLPLRPEALLIFGSEVTRLRVSPTSIDQFWNVLVTGLEAVRTPGVERATGRDVDE